MTYLLSPDIGRVSVRVDAGGQPTDFVWQKRRHRIAEIVNRWRLHDRWWYRSVARDYYKVTTADGWLVVLYFDWSERTWYLERLQD